MRKLTIVLGCLCFLVLQSPAEAQYVMVLKNGRQLTVQSYRQEGGMVKFFGLGGEISLSKDQIQAIRRADEVDQRSSTNLTVDQLRSAPTPQSSETTTKPAATKLPAPPPTPTETPAAKKAAEEKIYQQKVKELTATLQQLREQYAARTRGNTGPEPQFFTTEEAFKGHQEDLLSRLRDAQYRAQGLPRGSAAQTPPFALDAPPAYTEKQKELSDLRSRISQVESERQKLIEEMKAKNFDIGSLFLD
jgi:transcription-repair coupling factor (superfamily II helicase)